MIKKVILLIESPFNKRDYKRLGIEILQQNGFKTEVWDLSHVFYANLNLTPPDPFEFQGLRAFNNKSEVTTALKELTSNDMIITWFVYPRFFWLYKAISNSKTHYSAMFLVSAPPYYKAGNSLPYRKSIFNRICNIVLKNRWVLMGIISRIKNKIFTSIPYQLLGIKPITFWFAATAKNLDNPFPYDKKTKIVFLHVFDYDLYLEQQQKTSIELENNAAFLDIYLPFHEDNDMIGSPHLITADKYYPSLCRFFDYVEKEQNTKVVIAAHPRSHYEDHPDYFNNRISRMGQTIELVKGAKFVITHDSASFNFAIMYYKPMIFIITEEMVRNNLVSLIYNMASWFGKEPINIDKPFCLDWGKELAVNKEQYDIYINTFIKQPGTENNYSWQIVANKLKEQY